MNASSVIINHRRIRDGPLRAGQQSSADGDATIIIIAIGDVLCIASV